MGYSLATQDYAITSGGSSATSNSERLSQDRTPPDSEFRPGSRARFKPGYFPGFRRWTRLCERATKARPGEADLPEMSSIAIALVVTGLITAGGLIGLVLQRFLPERYTSDKARDMIGGVVGQLTLLLVLVNGLLIWTAYGVYSTQQTELQTITARALEFDLEMRQFGPLADEARSILRTDLVWAHEQFWGDDTSRAAAYEASYRAMADMNKFLDGLDARDIGADEPSQRSAGELRLHRRAAAPHVAAGGDPDPLAYGLRCDVLRAQPAVDRQLRAGVSRGSR